jgi:ketosteroid isomerase-like protein
MRRAPACVAGPAQILFKRFTSAVDFGLVFAIPPGMDRLETLVREFAELLQKGRPLDAMEKFYAPEVTVFENRQLARAGKARCLQFERDALANQPEAPRFKLGKLAVDESRGHAFLEYVVRFRSSDGRPQRLEEVAVQSWDNGLIVQERFYYEGIVDEGDEP